MVGQVLTQPSLPDRVNVGHGRIASQRHDTQVGANHVRICAILLADEHSALGLQFSEGCLQRRWCSRDEFADFRHEARMTSPATENVDDLVGKVRHARYGND